MSEANVTSLLNATRAFNRLAADVETIDQEALSSWLGFMHPDVRFEPQQSALQGAYVGHDGARQWVADITTHFGSGAWIEYDETRDVDDRVLALGTARIAGRSSGIHVNVPVACLATFRDGLIVRFRDFGEHGRALEAAGLSE